MRAIAKLADKMVDADVLVVGSGGAGVRAAIEASIHARAPDMHACMLKLLIKQRKEEGF